MEFLGHRAAFRFKLHVGQLVVRTTRG